MGRNTGVMIMPETIEDIVRAKNWMLARDKEFRIVYIPITESKKQPVLMTNFDLIDRILYRLTFSHSKAEKIKVFG